MGQVRELKAGVYRKIAAGEVVERPLSVVKELIENAIDAGATRLDVELEEGGRRKIKVTDNGRGFAAEDIELAFRRHTTSKISEIEDLDTLNTLGFRGEALASILEVSRISLTTADNSSGRGIKAVMEAGAAPELTDVACDRGTVMEVADLFFNFPVRRKFLKSNRTELNQVSAYLEGLALAYHDIAFSLTHNSRTLFVYSATSDLRERAYQVLGREIAAQLVEVSWEEDGYSCCGLVSGLNRGVSHKKMQYFFVNRRPVREKTLYAALNNTCGTFLEKHRSPVAVLLLRMPSARVDVNIHPMKIEIRFHDSRSIYRLLNHALTEAVRGEYPDLPSSVKKQDSPLPDEQVKSGLFSQQPRKETAGSENGSLFEFPLQSADRDFQVLGQFQNSYILVEKDRELLIVDQHNAHERVNFNKLKKDYHQNTVATVSPLFPMVLELTVSEAGMLEKSRLDLFAKIGFELEPMGTHSCSVRHYPAVLGEDQVADAVRDLLHSEFKADNPEDSLLARVACRSAIKVNHPLTRDEMEKLVTDLFKTANPDFCPHQRPVIVHLSLEEIEKMVKRR